MSRTLIEKTPEKTGEKIEAAGWIHSVRSHGNVTFLDLRDRSGLLQVVVDPEEVEKAEKLKKEWVIKVEGEIEERPEDMINEDIISGKVELQAESIEIYSQSETPPFSIKKDGKKIGEELRMKYRYLDLRRQRMNDNLRTRHEINQFLRNFLTDRDFIEVETPILTKSTPEGARDFLVPSRKHPGNFYALPQSPQQYKQLLMLSGVERYFQFARCFRDEDVRADRQAEFTQLDMEVSFMNKEDFLEMIEKMFIDLVETLFPEKEILEKPFPRISHKKAMEKWETDRPDLRKDKSNPDKLAFAFVVDFPMFEKKGKEWSCEHHPFTQPKTDDPEKLKKNPGNVLANQYDLVLNGEEIGGGSLRTYQPEMLEAVFEVLGYEKQEISDKFGHLLEAFEYGVPPHGGIAFGFERLLMVLLEEENIREVMAFPKTGDGRGLMMDTPSRDVSKKQLEDLHVEIIEDEEE